MKIFLKKSLLFRPFYRHLYLYDFREQLSWKMLYQLQNTWILCTKIFMFEKIFSLKLSCDKRYHLSLKNGRVERSLGRKLPGRKNPGRKIPLRVETKTTWTWPIQRQMAKGRLWRIPVTYIIIEITINIYPFLNLQAGTFNGSFQHGLIVCSSKTNKFFRSRYSMKNKRW